MINRPKISFLVPYRWFNEDKEFLSENLYRMVKKQLSRDDDMSDFLNYTVYKVVIQYQYHKPVPFTITKAGIQRNLKKVFPNAKCVSAEVQYKQSKNYPLPACDFQLYF